MTEVGKQSVKFRVWYVKEEDGLSHSVTPKTLKDAQVFIAENDFHYWRIDQMIQLIIDAKDSDTHVPILP